MRGCSIVYNASPTNATITTAYKAPNSTNPPDRGLSRLGNTNRILLSIGRILLNLYPDSPIYTNPY